MNTEFKIFIIGLSKEIIRENGETLTSDKLIEVYKKLMNEMNLSELGQYSASNPTSMFITKLKPVKPLF